MRRIYRLLRSRRLAAWLLIVMICYVAAATLLPLGRPENPVVVAWGLKYPRLEAIAGPLKLHQPFISPPFLVIAVLLVGSTAACSWERTALARVLVRAARLQDDSPRLPGRPSFVCGVEDRTTSHAAAQTALRNLRMRTRSTPDGVIGTQNLFGAWGSPLFHWSLVALFVLVGAGQLTRSEGSVVVVRGSEVVDARASYLNGLATGPLFGERFTGMRLRVSRITKGLVVDGVNHGDTPYVEAVRDGRVVEQGYVYPNHPVRVGSVLIHKGPFGPAVYVSLTLPDGDSIRRRPVALTDSRSGSASRYATLVISAIGTEQSHDVVLENVSGGRIMVRIPSVDYASSPLEVGDTVELPIGVSLTLDERTLYSSLTLANDWSVPFIYVAFVLAVLGETAALFFPPRIVVARFRDDGRELSVWVLRKRLDPGFPAAVENGVRERLSEHTSEERS